MKAPKIHTFFLVITMTWLTIAAFLQGCRKDEFNNDHNFQLGFSNDTVIFDTVFTSVGTATQALMVYNESDLPVEISSIKLAGGSASPYRINIDGDAVYQKKAVEIASKDSLFIFVKVTIDPNNLDSPLIRTDSILFETNGNTQNVKLVAWGQDAYFHNNDTIVGNAEFQNNKPHVVYGNLVVDSLSTLTIAEGVQLCFHKNSGLIVSNSGKLKVNGTLAKPVIFRSDTYVNFDPVLDTVPGMWNGIWLRQGSSKHDLSFAEIRNSDVGIMIDSTDVLQSPALTLYNCIISNTVSYGIKASSTSILAANCEISNCGGFLLAAEGGSYDFRHCTFANYWQWQRKTPSVYLSNEYYGLLGEKHESALQNAYFGNCIIFGNFRENDTLTEVVVNEIKDTPFNFTFDNCLVINNLQKHYSSAFNACIMKADSVFRDTDRRDFQPDSLSPVLNIGSRDIINFSPLNITSDLRGISRVSDSGPDLGAYERVEKQ